MSMDWENFFRYGFNPALQSIQDYQNFMRQSQLSTQQHKQRMKEMKAEFGLRRKESSFEQQLKKELMDYDATIERSLTMDKENWHLNRIKYENEWQQALKQQTFENQKAITHLQGKYSLERARMYTDAMKHSRAITDASIYNPNLPDEINEANFSLLRSGIDQVTQEILRSEQEIDAIQSDPGFQKIHRKSFTAEGQSDLLTEDIQFYKEKIDQIEKLETAVSERRKRLLGLEGEYVKYLFGFKQGNPIMMQEEDMQRLNQMGFPIPIEMQMPKSQLGIDAHLKVIQDLVFAGRDIPSINALIEIGLDPLWIQTNWPQYREYFRNRKDQMTNMISSTHKGLSAFADMIGKNIGLIF